ncbi:ubiquitin [Tubulinosema ratisbonensis]|uniref:Ubiquitin n=1 Tax=Tubulinosema ratisbonensis TaxID=291195 RepID=A0A437AQ33_9MICR|nr:ubiquitin [Tubulinosema ratisbonensis]
MARPNPTYLKRLMTEEKELIKENGKYGYYAFPRRNNGNCNYLKWDVYIVGPPESPYEGTILHAELEFTTHYPLSPPKMRFLSKMFHPNIYENGNVCISILHDRVDEFIAYESPDERWSPVLNISSITLSVTSILYKPNINSPANVDAAKLYRENIKEYEKKVRDLALKESVDLKTFIQK